MSAGSIASPLPVSGGTATGASTPGASTPGAPPPPADPHGDGRRRGPHKPAARELRSFLLALMVHVLLFAMLFVGIRWQTQRPVAVQAELWTPPPARPIPQPEPRPTPPEPPAPRPAPEPEPVAPPPPKPEPLPAVKPDIALEQQKERERLERERMEAETRRREEEARKQAEAKKVAEARRLAEEKKAAEARKAAEEKKALEEKRAAEARKAAEEKKALEEKKAAEVRKAAEEKKAAEAKRQAERERQEALATEKSREEYMKRLMAQAGTGPERGTPAPQGAATGATAGGAGGGTDAGYVAKLSSLLRANTTYQVPADVQGNPKAVFQVIVLPDCSIASVKLKRSSGVPSWDQAAERGIQRSSPLPRQADGSCPPELEIMRGPRDER